jgi:hypothetical protein
LNACATNEDIRGLSGKLVQFECMVQDMYNEEYFMVLLKQASPPLFHKYFSELPAQYEYCGGEMDPRCTSQRGTLLGVTIPNCSPWFNNAE